MTLHCNARMFAAGSQTLSDYGYVSYISQWHYRRIVTSYLGILRSRLIPPGAMPLAREEMCSRSLQGSLIAVSRRYAVFTGGSGDSTRKSAGGTSVCMVPLNESDLEVAAGMLLTGLKCPAYLGM
jgi:hypothetical protein